MEHASHTDESDKARRLILATCTALGGYDDIIHKDGTVQRVYSIGDEALACLKDLKRILRADELFTKDVLIELNVIETDLIPIIVSQSKQASATANRFILACTEILVPMTWPIPRDLDKKDDEDMDPNLLQNYRKIKLKLLEKGVFEATLRVCIQSLKIPFRERSSRDQSIIRLILYFWRNMTAITDPKASGIASDDQILLSTLQERLLVRFHESNVLELILTMASMAGTTDSAEWNVIILEIIYNLLEFASAKSAFKMTDMNASRKQQSTQLSSLLQTENKQKRLKIHHPSSRHNRFGGSYTLEGWDGSKHVSLNQNGGYANIEHLVSLRKKNRAGQKRKEMDVVGTHHIYQDVAALAALKYFSKCFMESCFNNFYLSLLKSMEREDKTIVERDYTRFYFTKKWFLEYFSYEYIAAKEAQAEATRQRQVEASNHLILPNRQKQKDNNNNNNDADIVSAVEPESSPLAASASLFTTATTDAQAVPSANKDTESPSSQLEDDEEQQLSVFDYDLIANMVDMKMFGSCMRRMRICLDAKNWFDVQVTADCLRQMLLTINSMNQSPVQDYRDVAEYIQSNLYHEQAYLDIFPDLIKCYRNQSFGYLEATIQLVHVILKLLEQYCKKQKVFFVRKKQGVRKSSTAKKKASAQEHDGMESGSENEGSETEEDRDRKIAYREHVFAFESFEKRFTTYDCIRVCCVLLEEYKQLRPEILHSITSLFHRIMVKRKAEHLFWKLPTLELFSRIIHERGYVPKSSALDQLVEFIRYVVRQFFKKAEQYPLLFVEVLFKIEPCRDPTPRPSPSEEESHINISQGDQPAQEDPTPSAAEPVTAEEQQQLQEDLWSMMKAASEIEQQQPQPESSISVADPISTSPS